MNKQEIIDFIDLKMMKYVRDYYRKDFDSEEYLYSLIHELYVYLKKGGN